MKEPLFFITGNKNKFEEVKKMLPSIKQLDIDLPEIQSLNPEEVVKAKLIEAKQRRKGSFIIEDTSLYIKSLKNLPGPLIKWFLESLGVKGLADLASKYTDKTAYAKTMIGYLDEKEEYHFFEGFVKGKIVNPRGKTKFGWDPIFKPDGYDKTFAEMSSDEKNKLSMRRKSINKLIKYLTN